jgi:hypothetical protein
VILNKGKKGYAHHPETLRWRGKLKALYLRHEELVQELNNRGYAHKSILNKRYAVGCSKQNDFVDSPRRQLNILRGKKCSCKV